MGTLKKYLASMQGNRVYFDTNMFIYFLEGDETYLEKCLPFFQAVADGEITGVSGDLTLAELLVKPMRVNDTFGIEKIKSLFDINHFFTLLPHNREILEFAAHIRATQKLSMVDAIHLSTAMKTNCTHIITNDEKVAKRANGIRAIWLDEVTE